MRKFLTLITIALGLTAVATAASAVPGSPYDSQPEWVQEALNSSE